MNGLAFFLLMVAGFVVLIRLPRFLDRRHERKMRKRRQAIEVDIATLPPEVRAILHKRTGGTYKQPNGLGFTYAEIERELDAEFDEANKLRYFYEMKAVLEKFQR
jgi:hypothetical protein